MKESKYYKEYIEQLNSIAEEIERNNRNNEIYRNTKENIRGLNLFKFPKFEELNFATV